ncbi:hypothetical protein FUAX_36460 [Fulvitalea axinellae]|uniref:Right-handed parallel beta-helix repeat-containing protein n=1 Tax=Fulvitalea axinellae TaxID=1182444 RepID=A0AAU9CXI7_9BACT|nr:hypothetical protein FUAX_36460 [Fulvitalea axinellae]
MGIRLRNAFALLCLLTAFFACDPEDETITADPNIKLEFSTDTISFDTLLTGYRSITQRVKIYNRDKNAVRISSVFLSGEDESPYRMTLNGETTPIREDLVLNGSDSLLILVDVEVPEDSRPEIFKQEGNITFLTNGNSQSVKLLTWAQNAVTIGKQSITEDLLFSDPRPYWLKDTITVEEGTTLILGEGTKILADPGASIVIRGKLKAQGLPDNRILIRNIRQDGLYKHGPGQWEGISLTANAQASLSFTDILNAKTAISADGREGTARLEMEGSKLENCSESNLIAINTKIQAKNCLFDNAGDRGIVLLGSEAEFTHCTIANYGFQLVPRFETLWISDKAQVGEKEESYSKKTNARFRNCIVTGNSQEELGITLKLPESTVSFSRSLLKTQSLDKWPDNRRIAGEYSKIMFQNPAEFDYRLDSLEVSPAKDYGLPANTERDLEDKTRDEKPDAGAYEQVIKEKKS